MRASELILGVTHQWVGEGPQWEELVFIFARSQGIFSKPIGIWISEDSMENKCSEEDS